MAKNKERNKLTLYSKYVLAELLDNVKFSNQFRLLLHKQGYKLHKEIISPTGRMLFDIRKN